MADSVRLAFSVTMWAWGALEVLLQTRQLLRSGRTTSHEWRSLLVFNALGVAGFVLARPVARATPGLSYSVHVPVAIVLLIVTWLGIGFRLWSIHTLGRYFRATVHIQEGHRVVTWGPYRLVRHPSYTGGLLAAAAASAMFGAAASWLTVMGCLAVAVGYRIRVEEAMLSRALGQSYTEYAARTRRLVPGLW